MDSKQDSVDLVTAAGRLGLSVATLRKRLQRGTIAGFKAADSTWRVVLDKADSKLDSPGQTTGPPLDKAGPDHAALVDALLADIQFLRAELQARDDEIQRRDEEIRRIHVLLQQLQQQPPARALPDHGQDWMQQWMRMWLWWLPR